MNSKERQAWLDARNLKIVQLRKQGLTHTELGTRFGMSRQRIDRILKQAKS